VAEVVKAKNLKTALKEAEKREVPLVITYCFPDSKIGREVRELTGKEGKVVFLSIGSKDKNAFEFKQRFDLIKAGAVLTDEFGNTLRSGLKNSEEIAEAYYELDDLMADRYQAWSKAIKKGKLLIKQGQSPEAAAVLKVFAFAAGTNLAKEGKSLFDKVAREASDEYEKLVADNRDKKAKEIDKKTRDTLLTALTAFVRKWPGTPAAFSAEAFKKKLVPTLAPGFAGADVCAACHEEQYGLWEDGGHNKVSCETCHGPAGDHIPLDADPRPPMRLPGESQNCLSCHGSPNGTAENGIPQVESLEAHVRFVGEKHSVKTDVKKTKGRCIFCHDPHSLE